MTLSNKGALNASISGLVTAGPLDFTFADLVMGTSIGNGQHLGDFTSYAVLGSFAGAVFTPFTLGGTYDLILGFNDGMRVDSDYDDIVVGLKIAAIPEPEAYALMLAGLAAVGVRVSSALATRLNVRCLAHVTAPRARRVRRPFRQMPAIPVKPVLGMRNTKGLRLPT